MTSPLNRRNFLGAAAASGALLVSAAGANAQQNTQQNNQQRINPVPAPRDWSGNTAVQYPDPDIVVLDERFRKYIVNNTSIKRLYTGTLWAEGPAWNGVGRYLVWSDIPNNRQMRWTEEDGHVSVFRDNSGYSNGNTFDYEGREVSCEHGGRRVVRYEYDGSVTVIADHWHGGRLNSPNDVSVHPDGSIWFTDPPFGIRGNYEGFKAPSEVKPAVYRVDKSGQMDMITDEMSGPNGVCFSHDYKKVYIADTVGREVRVYAGYSRHRRAFGGGWNARGYRRQLVVRRASRSADRRTERRTHRIHSPAGNLRQHQLRRAEAESPVHGRQFVALHGVRGDAGRAHLLGAGRTQSPPQAEACPTPELAPLRLGADEFVTLQRRRRAGSGIARAHDGADAFQPHGRARSRSLRQSHEVFDGLAHRHRRRRREQDAARTHVASLPGLRLCAKNFHWQPQIEALIFPLVSHQ